MADLGNISKIQLINGDVAHFQDLVSGYTSNTGTITGIKMNGSSKGTSGVVDLGTVITAHQDISGKADKSATVSTIAWDSTNSKLTKTINGTTTDVVTIATIKSALALPDPMVFKGSLGTGGTITSLPTAAASNKGYTYKVITAGTYTSQSAKVGDTFISDGSAWVLIPSGDEPSGTVTSVGVSNGGGLSVSGSPITSSGTITISHADTSSQASSSNSGRTYIQSITLDTYGHVTGLSTATETVTDTKNTAGTTNKTNTKMYLAAATEQNSNPQTYSNANVYIGTDNCLYSNGAKVLTSHQDISGKIDTAGTGLSKSGTTLNHSNSVTAQTTQAVYPIKIDAQGHISGYGSAVTIVNTRGTATSGGTTLSVVNTGDMYTWNNKSSATNWLNGSQSGSVRTSGSRGEGSSYTIGQYAVAEGWSTTSSGHSSHAEGYITIASGDYSHAEGLSTSASGGVSHAEGENTTASGSDSHAEGYYSDASGVSSHAGGIRTIAQRRAQTAIGEYNIADTTGFDGSAHGSYAFIIGNGTADNERSNALTVNWNGGVWAKDTYYIGNISTTDDIYKDITALGWSDVFV